MGWSKHEQGFCRAQHSEHYPIHFGTTNTNDNGDIANPISTIWLGNGRAKWGSVCWCSCIKRNSLRQWRKNWNQDVKQVYYLSVYDWRYLSIHSGHYGNHEDGTVQACFTKWLSMRLPNDALSAFRRTSNHTLCDRRWKGYRTDWKYGIVGERPVKLVTTMLRAVTHTENHTH